MRRRAVAALMAVLGVAPAGAALGPVSLNGYLGYNYRALNEGGGQESLSHQLSGTINGSTYLWQPWLATLDGSVTFTQDSSDYTGSTLSTSTSSQIVTGDLGLSLFPRSRTPFTARLRFSDSRVDREQTGATPVTFVGDQYSSTFLGLQQVWQREQGDRYRLRLDLHSWDSERSGRYDETSFGADADIRRPGHRLVARASFDQTDHSLADRKNESLVADLSHYYYPARGFRVDSKLSLYSYDRSFLDPSSDDTRLSTTDIAQMSSFVYWRPASSPWTVSAGVRLASTTSSPDSVAGADQLQLSANAGLFYRYSQHLRFDASLSWSMRNRDDALTSESVSSRYFRERIGMLYSSRWYHFNGYMYQWYGDASAEMNVDPLASTLFVDGAIGHNLSKTWWPVERTTPGSLRFNFNQALLVSEASTSYEGDNALEQEIYEKELGSLKLRHSASLAYDTPFWNGDMMAQLTLSDTREMGDLESNYQLVNLQFSSTQKVGGLSLLTGNVTYQQVLGEYDEVIRYSGFDAVSGRNVNPGDVVTRERDTATVTASLRYEHTRLFGVPRLRFSSNYMISKISTVGALDREDWDNALSYSIGKLESSVSYRLTDTDGRNYDLLYFRVMRRF